MITIKFLEHEDEIKGKAFVHWKSWKEAYTGLVDQDFLDNRTIEMSEQRAYKAFESGYKTIVAKDVKKVIGFIDYGLYRGEDIPNAGEVYAFYILKEYYDKGIGYALMRKAIEEMKEYHKIAVWVLEKNERAIRFYTRFGYCFDGKKQILSMGTPITEARMVLIR